MISRVLIAAVVVSSLLLFYTVSPVSSKEPLPHCGYTRHEKGIACDKLPSSGFSRACTCKEEEVKNGVGKIVTGCKADYFWCEKR